MISSFYKTAKMPQKGDPQLEWFYVGKSPDCELSKIKLGRQYLSSQDSETKFTIFEKQVFQGAHTALKRSLEIPPLHWTWQEREGAPGYLPLFRAIAIGGIKRPRDVKRPASTSTLLYDNTGAGVDNSLQFIICTLVGLAEGFARIYNDQNCFDWYQSKLRKFESGLL